MPRIKIEEAAREAALALKALDEVICSADPHTKEWRDKGREALAQGRKAVSDIECALETVEVEVETRP